MGPSQVCGVRHNRNEEERLSLRPSPGVFCNLNCSENDRVAPPLANLTFHIPDVSAGRLSHDPAYFCLESRRGLAVLFRLMTEFR
jgi:hypothetical protein